MQCKDSLTSVGLVFRPVLLDADVLVDSGALLHIVGGALLPRGGLAKSLQLGAAHLLVHRLTDLQEKCLGLAIYNH